MRNVFYSSKFRKDVKIVAKRGLNLSLLKEVMLDLENGTSLDSKYKEHSLKGNYVYHLECHIQPDWLLIYRIDDDENSLTFVRTGTHSDLFN